VISQRRTIQRASTNIGQVADVSRPLWPHDKNIAAIGLNANQHRRTRAARDALRVARRFRDYEDMILRFITNLAVVEFTSNEAERTIRLVKVQQRSSGGCWRTLDGLAQFAIVESYLSPPPSGASAGSRSSVSSSPPRPGSRQPSHPMPRPPCEPATPRR
jgi:hypothetical protein